MGVRHLFFCPLLVVLFCMVAVPDGLQAQAELHARSLNLSFCKNLSTSPKPHGQWRHAFSLGLISAEMGQVRGFSYSTAYQKFRQGADGLLLTAGLTHATRQVRGLSLAGVGHYVEGGIAGFSLSGLAQAGRHSLQGVQVAGLANLSLKDLSGLALTAGLNLAWRDMRGLQLGAGNVAQRRQEGVQLGLLNMSGRHMQGLQLGLVNLTRSRSRGLQLGLVNRAWVNQGVHLGLVNVADSNRGLQLGLVNWVKNGGFRQLALSADDYLLAALTARLGVPAWYTLVQVGVGRSLNSRHWAWGLGVGSRVWRLSDTDGLHVEALAQLVGVNRAWTPQARAWLYRLQVLWQTRLLPDWGVSLGGVLNFRHNRPPSAAAAAQTPEDSFYAVAEGAGSGGHAWRFWPSIQLGFFWQ